MQENSLAYRYALGFYLCLAAFFWYGLHAFGIFLATHYTPQSAAGFSVLNPDFSIWNNAIATALTLVVVIGLLAWPKLKEFIVDSGDELTRVSYADLKETRQATVVVVVLVLVSSVVMFCFDFIFLKIVNFIMGTAL